jgi:hypothetical protein
MSQTNEFSEEKKAPIQYTNGTDSDDEVNSFTALISEDHSHEIKLRTMSWQKAAWLLCGDQVCLAIMAQSWSLS